MLFKLQLLISFLIGGLFVGIQTLIAERLTGFWRNVMLTLPSMLTLGLLFVGLHKTPADVIEVARVVPAGLSADYLFVAAFAVLSRYGLAVSMIGALTAWLFSAFVIITFPPATFTLSIFLYGIPFIIIAYLIVQMLPGVSTFKPFPFTPKNIFIRSVLAGGVITLVVFLSKTLGNVWGGLFSAFPATFSSTFIIYYYMQGKKVLPSVARSFFFPGWFGFIVYTLIAAVTFPPWGIWLGTVTAYAATFLFFYCYFLAYKKLSSKKLLT